MQFDNNLTGPDLLEAVAEAELHNGNEINAAAFRAQARQWRGDVQLLAEARARIAILEARQASASAALAA